MNDNNPNGRPKYTNVQYRVEWSYPSSPNAVGMGFGRLGCWTVERTVTVDGVIKPPQAIRGYANRIEACAYVDALQKKTKDLQKKTKDSPFTD